ncbi:MAG: hypothetical protein [Circoviridae sp.]|nr:MAG: hypothetical protein [Circoviridae sp.]
MVRRGPNKSFALLHECPSINEVCDILTWAAAPEHERPWPGPGPGAALARGGGPGAARAHFTLRGYEFRFEFRFRCESKEFTTRSFFLYFFY